MMNTRTNAMQRRGAARTGGRGGQRGGGSNWGSSARSGFDQGRGFLNYQAAQKKSAPEERQPAFSSFFAPQPAAVVRSEVVELGLLIKKYWVGQVIGKKGATIREIRQKSKGANIDFGDDELTIEESDDKWEQSPWITTGEEKFKVCAISGLKEQASEATKAIAGVLAECAQSEDYKLWFLVPQDYVGVFIGKKGAHLKEMKEGTSNITINVHRKPLSLGENEVAVCTIFGPSEDALLVIERCSNWLGEISIKVQAENELERRNTMSDPVSMMRGPGQPNQFDDMRYQGRGMMDGRDMRYTDVRSMDARVEPMRGQRYTPYPNVRRTY